jgi:hypothetical protein
VSRLWLTPSSIVGPLFTAPQLSSATDHGAHTARSALVQARAPSAQINARKWSLVLGQRVPTDRWWFALRGFSSIARVASRLPGVELVFMTTFERCDGWVRILRGEIVVFTGRVLVDEEWVVQAECCRLVERRRGECRDKPSGIVTLVVHGDLAGSPVVDPSRRYSEKLVFAQDERTRGRHVHVVDAAGFSDLLHGRAARCRRLRRDAGSVRVVAESGDLVLAEPFDRQSWTLPPVRSTRRLAVDLEALDRATVAHERTVRHLAAALASVGVTPHLPARRGP